MIAPHRWERIAEFLLPEALTSVGVALTALLLGVMAPVGVAAQQGQYENLDRFEEECPEPASEEEDHSRLTDYCLPLADIPDRPRGLLELGEPFLGTGVLGGGFGIPGGAIWQPAFLAFGTLRTAVQGVKAGEQDPLAEAVGRLDLFGNLYLTQTERIVVGLRPLDEDGSFTRYTITDPFDEPSTEEGEFTDELNATVQTLFFEGDLRSLFPAIDRDDTRGLDIYFSVGRQPIAFQDGLLIAEDKLDMVGLTRANMRPFGAINARATLAYAWGEVTRHGGFLEDDSSQLVGLFTEFDTRASTMEIDVAYVMGDELSGDGIYAGISDIRRLGGGHYNNTFRVLGSFPIGDETPFNTQGVLVHNQLSWTPYGNHNWWYVGAFGGFGEFRSAARASGIGGPVGQTGILFAGPGIGRIGSSLGGVATGAVSAADDAVGASLGHQMFFDDSRRQLLLEVGGRFSIAGEDVGTPEIGVNLAGAAARYQMAMGRRFVLVLDGTAGYDMDAETTTAAGRFELVLKL